MDFIDGILGESLEKPQDGVPGDEADIPKPALVCAMRGEIDCALDEVNPEMIAIGPRQRRSDQVTTVSATQVNHPRGGSAKDALPVEGHPIVAIPGT